MAAQALSFTPEPTVPVYSDLANVYSDGAATVERYKAIATAFELAFGGKPDIYARAPGRVNLIGEHIDYEGYGVLPMAIRQDTVVAVRRAPAEGPGAGQLVIGNVESGKYPTQTFAADPAQTVDTANHSWANYFVSAYKGAFELLAATRPSEVPAPAGLQVVVQGQVPTGSGLSSSSAIVCASLLAVLAAHGITGVDKAEVAEAACKAERYVGVTSGGMDQAISMMGQAGVAMHVEFNPVRGVCVVLPPGAVFVIANSLAVSNKAETAPKRYNLRVVECRLAAVLLAMSLGWSREEALEKARTLRDVEPLIATRYGAADGATAAAAAAAALRDEYDTAGVEAAIGGGVTLAAMYGSSPAALRAVEVAQRDGYRFPLRRRAVHVYQEAQRVLDFRAVCEDASLAPADRLGRLGRLMSDSHTSCGELYGCSCAELDELVAIARGAGALGARLTGAGWGGCMVSLVREADVPAFLATMQAKFYQSRISAGRLSEAELSEVLFATKPSSGAAYLRLA